MGDIVSGSSMNDYFSKRNMITGISGLAFTLIGGLLLSYSGFETTFLFAIVIGLTAVVFFSRMHETVIRKEYHYKYSLSLRPSRLLNFVRINRNYTMFTAYVTMVNFAVDIASLS